MTNEIYNKAYIVTNPLTPFRTVVFDEEVCVGCNACIEVCRTDVMLPNPEKGKPPIVVYPEECWYCGCCTAHCAIPGAISLEHPLYQSVGWKRKETGEYFRTGMKNPPPPNTRPRVA